MSDSQNRQIFVRPTPSKEPTVRRAKVHLDRAARLAKTKKLKVAAAVSGLIATTFFSGLAAQAGGTHAHSSVVSADQQVTRLEQSNNGAFFSVGGSFVPPQPGNGGAQTSSGGS
jgi:hypothetical protein